MKLNLNQLVIVLIFSFFPYSLISQEATRIQRLKSEIDFDGRPFEEAWQGLSSFSLTMHQPDYGLEPSESGVVNIGYDNEYLWIGARLSMSDASRIVSVSKKRDEMSLYHDSFTIMLDTYNDNENFLAFYTMPSGLRSDYSVSNDANMSSSLSSFNSSWNTFWDVKTSRDDEGWYVEMRIPFSSLKFKPDGDVTRMGMIIRRVISNNNEMDTYPAIDPKYGQTANSKPSRAAKIEFEGLRASNPVYVSPYIITGNTRNWALNTENDLYIKKDDPELNAGIDIKYNINSNLTLDLTANTDFAQVEADDQQVNLTRYSLYFPEKRMFFQERSGLFDYSLGGFSKLFYSRNIGLKDGESVRIYGGARMVGRIGRTDVGLLDMQTEEHGGSPGENFGVIRMRRQVINPYSYIGGMLTSKIGTDGSTNLAYGLDGILRMFGNDYLDIKIAQTYDDKLDNKISSLEPAFLSASWERRSIKGFAYGLGYSYSGEKFSPGIGFVNKGSLQGFTGNVLYGWLPGVDSRFFKISTSVNVSRYTRLTDGELESVSVSPDISLETKSGIKFSLAAEYQNEGVLFSFPISAGIFVPAGIYSFTSAAAGFSTSSSKPLYATFNLNAGEFYDGTKYSFSFTPVINLSSGIQLTASYQFNRILFTNRNQEVSIHLASTKILYMISTKLTVSANIQYLSTSTNLTSNFRLRYNPREGNDFYLVFNDYRALNKTDYEPVLPDYFTRTVLLKYTHTFRL